MEFIKPEEGYLDEYLAACRESVDHDVTEWMPVEPERFGSWKEHALEMFEMLEHGNGLPEGVPRMITYWCVENGTFIGEIQIRPYLPEDEAKSIGHIGYAVRYSRWNQGYGTKLLQWAVEKLRESGVSSIYIACHTGNQSSNRVSEKVGFQFAGCRNSGTEQENLYVLRF